MENNIKMKGFNSMKVKEAIWELIRIRAWLRFISDTRKETEKRNDAGAASTTRIGTPDHQHGS